MTYRIEKEVDEQFEGLTLIRRSDTRRLLTLRILGTFFTGLGAFGIFSVWWRLELFLKSDGALLPILFGLSVSVLCLGGHFLSIEVKALPKILQFDGKLKMLLIGSKESFTPVFKIPYQSLQSFVMARNLVRSNVGQTSHKRIRFRVLLVLKNLAAWTLAERQAWPKEKRPREKILSFLSALKERVDLEKSGPECGILDVNDCPMRFLINETTKSWRVSWQSSSSLKGFWGLGIPMGLLLGLFSTFKETELNRVLLGVVIIPVVLWALYLVSRIVHSLRTECGLEFVDGRFKAHFKGSAWPWSMNLSQDWIGSFRFELPEFGRAPVLLVVPRPRHESDARHYEELADESVTMRTQYRSSRARPLREKWVKTIDVPGLGFEELVYLAALLNERLEESRSSSASQ